MGLPTSREETAVNGVPVNPNTINAIQDAIIGLNALVGAGGWVDYSPHEALLSANMAAQLDGTHLVTSTADFGFTSPIRVPTGAAIDGLRMRIKGTADPAVFVSLGIGFYRDEGRTHIGTNVGGIPPKNMIVTPVNGYSTYTDLFAAPYQVNTDGGMILIVMFGTGQAANTVKVQSIGYRLTVP